MWPATAEPRSNQQPRCQRWQPFACPDDGARRAVKNRTMAGNASAAIDYDDDGLPVYNTDYVCKLVLFGAMGCGKSSFLHTWLSGTQTQVAQPTIGVDYGTLSMAIGERTVQVQAFDTSGNPAFAGVTGSFLRGADAVLVFFDVATPSTLSDADRYLTTAQQMCRDEVPKLLVGMKVDLQQQVGQRKVRVDEGFDLARKHGALYAEASSYDVDSVRAAMSAIVGQIMVRCRQREARSRLP